MPKVYLTEQAKKDDKLRYYIGQQMGGLKLNQRELAHKIGYKSAKTLVARIKNPDLFTRGELRTLAQVLRLTDEQVQEGFF